MNWREEYKRKLVSPEEAVKVIQSGDLVEIAIAPTLESALGARSKELRNVVIHGSSYREELPWFQPGHEESFIIHSGTRPVLWGQVPPNLKISDIIPPSLTFLRTKLEEERDLPQSRPDVFMVTLSKPDDHGFCSFGASLISKKVRAQRAKKVLAEVSDLPEFSLRTYGDNFIHVSEIDYLVEHVSVPRLRRGLGLLDRREPTEEERRTAQYVAELIRDGDTFEIGIGSVAEALPAAGAFTGKRDLGLHTGGAWKGLINLVKEGIVTGERKTLHRGKVVTTALQVMNGTEVDNEVIEFVHHNPTFEMYSIEYLHDFKVIAAHDNFVAINSVMAVDLSGQLTTESVGSRTVGVPGGFPAFHMGALLSRGGRSIVVMSSTTGRGTISRIVPSFPANTMVTVSRLFADYIVTEYGIASLMGKTQKKRVQELIAIAHPNFRADLRRQAEELY